MQFPNTSFQNTIFTPYFHFFLTELFEKTLRKQNKKGSANQSIDIIPLENIDQRQDV